jgi:hypothetical protein
MEVALLLAACVVDAKKRCDWSAMLAAVEASTDAMPWSPLCVILDADAPKSRMALAAPDSNRCACVPMSWIAFDIAPSTTCASTTTSSPTRRHHVYMNAKSNPSKAMPTEIPPAIPSKLASLRSEVSEESGTTSGGGGGGGGGEEENTTICFLSLSLVLSWKTASQKKNRTLRFVLSQKEAFYFLVG